MKRFISVILCMLLLFSLSSASAAKKSKSTPTPEPVDIGTDLVNPPEKIQQMLEIAYQEWVSVNGKDQGKKQNIQNGLITTNGAETAGAPDL